MIVKTGKAVVCLAALLSAACSALPYSQEIRPSMEIVEYDGKWTKLHNRLRDYSSNEDILCLALNAYHEARGSTMYDQIAITHVVLTRSKEKNLPICDVIWEHRQFTWTQDGKPDYPKEAEAWQRALHVAKVTYDGDAIDVTQGANHYHAHYVKPRWSKAGYDKITIGSHIFMKI